MAITHPTDSSAAGPGATETARAAVANLAGACEEIGTLTDADLVEAAGAFEALGRITDALRVRAAGEIQTRSEKSLGQDRLSNRYGCRTGSELLERLTRAPGTEVRRRAGLDARTRASRTLTGEELPPKFPDIAAALHTGTLGVETAELLTAMLTRVGPRADPAETAAAEAALVTTATGTTPATEDQQDPATQDPDPTADDATGPDHTEPGTTSTAPAPTFAEVKIHTQAWEAHLDQDGPDPEAQRAAARRGLSLGTARDGLIPIRGNLIPETAAQLTRLLAAHLNPAAGNHTTTGNSTGEGTPTANSDGASADTTTDSNKAAGTAGAANNPETATAAGVPGDERTPAQKRHDVLASLLTAAARSAETPSLGGDTATLLVHVNAEDLLDPTGIANLDGIDLPAPTGLAHRIACTGAVQKVVFDRAGRIVALGTKDRAFNAHQRRAITARDGGCIIPGCTIPAAWCEIHHVIPWAQGGKTHTDNGVLLCWHHHAHLESSGWEIRMIHGRPYVKAPAWHDPSGEFRPAGHGLTRRGRHRRPGPPPPALTPAPAPTPDTHPATNPGTSPNPDTAPGPDPTTDPHKNASTDTDASATPTTNPDSSESESDGEGSGSGAPTHGEDRDSGQTGRDDTTAGTRATWTPTTNELDFEARWDTDAAQTPPETAEERRARWDARDDEPPW